MSTNNDGPPRPGNEGFIINHHQSDCRPPRSETLLCDIPGTIGFGSHKLAREGFLKFTDGSGNDVATQAGDVLRGKLLIVPTEGVPVFGLSSNVQALADSTRQMGVDINGDDKVDHEPLTKWTTGFGQPFHPLDIGINAWQSEPTEPDVVSIFGYSVGFNQTYHQTWEPDGTQVHLTPDTDTCDQIKFNAGQCDLALPDPVEDSPFFREALTWPHLRYQQLEFQYTVGQDTYDMVQLDGFDVMACEDGPGPKDCGATSAVPITRPGDVIDGIFFGTSGVRTASFFFDDICITINESLDACNLTQGNGEPMNLLGDANNDKLVTGADLISVQQNFGTDYGAGCDGLGLGDANDDCLVTGADLIVVQQNFGKALAAPVPEPAAFAMFAVLLGLGVPRNRKF